MMLSRSPLQPRFSNHPHRLTLRHGGRRDDVQHDAAERRPDLGLWIAEEIGKHSDHAAFLDAFAALDARVPHASGGAGAALRLAAQTARRGAARLPPAPV